jgi:hypothetical protein
MITFRLTALALATLLSSAAIAATSTSDTGPTAPVDSHKSSTTQSLPGLNINGSGVDSGLPPSTGTDPRTQGNDAGRQGGMNLPDTQTPDNAGSGIGAKTTTGGSGSEGGVSH